MATGRPTAFKPEFVKLARKVAKLGATDIEIADLLGVTVRTLYRWRHDHPAFCQALSIGKSEPDARVARSLFQRAVGYTYESEKILVVGGKVKRVKILEHVAPDVKAQLAWLYNRDPENFKPVPDAKNVDDVPPPVSVTIEVKDAHMSQEQIQQRATAAADEHQAGNNADA